MLGCCRSEQGAPLAASGLICAGRAAVAHAVASPTKRGASRWRSTTVSRTIRWSAASGTRHGEAENCIMPHSSCLWQERTNSFASNAEPGRKSPYGPPLHQRMAAGRSIGLSASVSSPSRKPSVIFSRATDFGLIPVVSSRQAGVSMPSKGHIQSRALNTIRCSFSTMPSGRRSGPDRSAGRRSPPARWRRSSGCRAEVRCRASTARRRGRSSRSGRRRARSTCCTAKGNAPARTAAKNGQETSRGRSVSSAATRRFRRRAGRPPAARRPSGRSCPRGRRRAGTRTTRRPARARPRGR